MIWFVKFLQLVLIDFTLCRMKKLFLYLAILLLGISIGGVLVSQFAVCPLDPSVGTSGDGYCVAMTLYSVLLFVLSLLIFLIKGIIYLVKKT